MDVRITTASKSLERLSEAPAVVEVLTRDELARFGGTTLKDVLTRVPGLVAVSGYFSDRSMIAFPGDALAATSTHVLLLLNGRPVREVQEGGIKTAVLEGFPIDAIERIEVVKGPGSVLYGSEAFSGVINIITTVPDRSGLSVTELAGASGAHGTAATATIATPDFSMVIAGKYLNRADWQTPYTFQNGPTTLAISHTIPSSVAGTYVSARYGNLSLMGSIDQNITSHFIPEVQVLGDAQSRQFFADAGYALNVRDGWKMNFNLTYNKSRLEVIDTGVPLAISRSSHEVLSEWTSYVKPSPKAKIVFGGTAARTKGRETLLGTPIVIAAGTRTSYGGYVQADYQLLNSVKVIGGFQANKIGPGDVRVVPRAGLIWEPTPRMVIKALYGEAFRAPYINELYVDHPGLQGNPNLKPEHVSSIDIEARYIDAAFELAASYFDNRQKDNIILAPLPDQFRAQYVNAGLANIKGVEFSGKRYLSKAVYLTGSVLYQSSDDGNGQRDITQRAAFGAKVGVSYRTDIGTISLFDQYQGDVADRLKKTLNRPPGPYHMVALHALLSLSQALHLKHKPAVALVVQGDNLLNDPLWVPSLGSTVAETVPYDKGRAVYLGVKVGF